jgi:hypothetical protein
VTHNSTSPIVTIQPVGTGTQSKNSAFSIAIKSITEITPTHGIVFPISFSDIDFHVNQTTSGANTIYNYSANLENGAFIAIIVSSM